MKWENIKDNNNIPNYGWILAYTRQEVLFKEYKKNDLDKFLNKRELLEIHLFNQEKEFRAILSGSYKNQKKGFIEHVADFKTDDSEYVYQEEVALEDTEKGDKIIVLNHINYDDSGMAYIDDYRLIMPEMEEANA